MTRIVIAGVARNCAANIRAEIDIVLKAFAHHTIERIVIVESDSTDNSADVLCSWSNESECNIALSLGQLANIYPLRTERLAYCRNVYLNVFERHDYFGADFFFVTDLDGINTHLSAETIDRSISFLTSTPGAAATANQLYKYYDIWTLRHPIWSPNDCWASFHKLREIVGEVNAYRICIESRMIHVDNSLPPIPVDSAFGGAGIYPTSIVRSCRYDGLLNGKEACEHVAFNADYLKNGGQIYVVPYFINHDISEHVVNCEKFDQMISSASMVNNG